MTVYSELATEAVGLLTLTADDAGLSGVWLEAHRHAPTTRAGWVRDDDRLADAAGQLREYLTGDRRCFDLPLSQTAGTPFQHFVWAALDAIPYGTTTTYGGGLEAKRVLLALEARRV